MDFLKKDKLEYNVKRVGGDEWLISKYDLSAALAKKYRRKLYRKRPGNFNLLIASTRCLNVLLRPVLLIFRDKKIKITPTVRRAIKEYLSVHRNKIINKS